MENNAYDAKNVGLNRLHQLQQNYSTSKRGNEVSMPKLRRNHHMAMQKMQKVRAKL